jgi:hypothetical protein
MSTLPSEGLPPRAEHVQVTRDSLVVDLADGRTIIAPLSWYPRLHRGTPAERKKWRLIAGGEGIHWPDLDEDISVEGLLAGSPSGESQRSFRKWLENRRPPRSNTRLHPVTAPESSKQKRRRRISGRGRAANR